MAEVDPLPRVYFLDLAKGGCCLYVVRDNDVLGVFPVFFLVCFWCLAHLLLLVLALLNMI